MRGMRQLLLLILDTAELFKKAGSFVARRAPGLEPSSAGHALFLTRVYVLGALRHSVVFNSAQHTLYTHFHAGVLFQNHTGFQKSSVLGHRRGQGLPPGCGLGRPRAPTSSVNLLPSQPCFPGEFGDQRGKREVRTKRSLGQRLETLILGHLWVRERER